VRHFVILKRRREEFCSTCSTTPVGLPTVLYRRFGFKLEDPELDNNVGWRCAARRFVSNFIRFYLLNRSGKQLSRNKAAGRLLSLKLCQNLNDLATELRIFFHEWPKFKFAVSWHPVYASSAVTKRHTIYGPAKIMNRHENSCVVQQVSNCHSCVSAIPAAYLLCSTAIRRDISATLYFCSCELRWRGTECVLLPCFNMLVWYGLIMHFCDSVCPSQIKN